MQRRHTAHPHERTDAGSTLLELVVAIALTGIGVSAVLAALQTTTIASAIDEEHALANSWMQTASQEIYRGPRISCFGDPNAQQTAITAYDALAQAAPRPLAWAGDPDASISVTNVQFLGKPHIDAPDYEWGDTYCLEGGAYVNSEQYTQRVTIEVVTPVGIDTSLHMVKSDS